MLVLGAVILVALGLGLWLYLDRPEPFDRVSKSWLLRERDRAGRSGQ